MQISCTDLSKQKCEMAKYFRVFYLFIDMWLITTDLCTDSNIDIYCAASRINFSCFCMYLVQTDPLSHLAIVCV